MTTELDLLVRQIASDEHITTLANALRNAPGARLHVAPALSAARPLIAAALSRTVNTPVVYAVSTGEAALRAYSDVGEWLGDEHVVLFPASDAMPYEHMSPGMSVVADRLRTLRRLRAFDSAAGKPLVIVTPIKALTQPTLDPEDWTTHSVALRQSGEATPEELVRRWLDMGYRTAPTVEEPGELNRRGGIIDIFPPGDDLPLRIEFFGDEIDSLRRFNPVTQRSQERVQTAIVGPPHETPLWNHADAVARLLTINTDTLRPEALDEWNSAIERLANGERFEGQALFVPFFRADTPLLFAYLPPSTPLLLSEATVLEQHLAELHHQAEERRATQIGAGELPVSFPRPYLLWDEIAARSDGVAFVDLSNNEEWDLAEANGTAIRHMTAPHFHVTELFGGQLKRLIDDIATRVRNGEHVYAVTPQAARIDELVREALAEVGETGEKRPSKRRAADPNSLFVAVHGSLDAGWRLEELGTTLYTDAEIFGWRQRRSVSERKREQDRSAEERAAFLRGLKESDYVVHIEHGIAQYDGMVRRTVGNVEREYLNLRYADGDRLYVPVDQIDRLSRYIGAGDAAPQLTRLGTQEWERAKRKTRAAVQDLAEDLLHIYAQRQLSEGFAFSPDNEWQGELEDSFPYNETEDQLRAITDTKHDMEQQQPMDRLVCGDVGFGKTEVALRAAFKAVQDGKQVAILVPTTVLAQQHFDTFSRRMAAFPIKVEMVSRLRTSAEINDSLRRLLRGEIDIIIGTHRLLSKDVIFKDLGLLVVDEEQRFGVRHKERIKQMRANVDVLTLTATPIPRTLHMAMAGIRDMSVIDTPPQDRLPIRTYVLPYDDRLVREAVLREIDRGGQVFYLHNRVQSIYYVADKLKKLVPEAEVMVGHGQLEERQLEKVMLDFFSGKADVLVSTTIIESGLDVPNANTIIIDNATNYGLAQLYQLRGRVGRSVQRAYAYLFYPADRRLTGDAHERLLAIQEATELGAGLRIAMRDLEIRGAGNLLGSEQSGHIAAVGFDLYTRLLQQAVKTLKQQFDTMRPTSKEQPAPQPTEATQSAARPSGRRPAVRVDEKVLVSPLVTLDLPLDAYIPESYIPDEQVRLSIYQRLADAQTPEAWRDLRQELRDRFGEPPEPADCLLTWLLIKTLALQSGVTSIVTTNEEFIMRLPEGNTVNRELLRRRYGRDLVVKVGPQFLRLDRREIKGSWVEKMTDVLHVLVKIEHGERV